MAEAQCARQLTAASFGGRGTLAAAQTGGPRQQRARAVLFGAVAWPKDNGKRPSIVSSMQRMKWPVWVVTRLHWLAASLRMATPHDGEASVLEEEGSSGG
jgi:hypothetical protein